MPKRLALSASPYLRSHADNPVDWWPWGEEAFAEAARRDVPVLVSIGYSTCHWCHVMARESFSDPEVAAIMNENLVAIKESAGDPRRITELRNVVGDQGLIPVTAQPDGTTASARLPPERRWYLTNTFSF